MRQRIPDALLTVALGALLVALAYDRGRSGEGLAASLYWTGQVSIFVVVSYRVLDRSTFARDREVLVLVYAGAQSVIRWAYSPQGFTFSDELQHLRALNNVLETGTLFNPNFSLPISPQYPGLENVAAEMVQVSGLQPFHAGVVLASTTHVLSAACILLLFREVSRSTEIACAATLIYLLNPHSSFFNTSFLYETLALPFGVLTILFAVRLATRRRSRMVSFYAVLCCSAIVAATHHVSAIATTFLIGVVAATAAVFPASRRLAIPLSLGAGLTGLVVAIWVSAVAPITIEYLGAPLQQFIGSLASITEFTGSLDLPAPPTPLFDRVAAPVGVVLSIALITANLRFVRHRRPLERCWSWIALGLYLLATGTRVLITNGAELSGRLLTFAAMFSALAVGTTLWRIATSKPTTFRNVSNGLLTSTAISVVLLLGSITTSLPAWWQRVPGQFVIEGFASGIDSVGTSRAEWAAQNLRPGSRYVGDITSLTLLSTIGGLDPVKDPGAVYYGSSLSSGDIAHIKSSSVVYVDVDLRMSEYFPMGGKYFPQDVLAGELTGPVDRRALTKFDDIKGISRIYDSGVARVYDLRGGRESPYAH